VKYCRFVFENRTHYGRVEERGGEFWIVDLIDDAPEEDLAYHLARARGEARGALVTDLPAFDFEPMPLASAQLLTPVTPSKIVCVGRNYSDHAKELGNEVPTEPLIFMKPPSSLLAPGGVVRMPAASARVDYEGELAIVIGRRIRRFKAEDDWRGAIRGYTLANDVTARDLQKKEGQWTRGKGWDTFCPVGPFVSDEIDVAAGVAIETRLNSEVKQHGSTADFIFSIPELFAYITQAITLEPGDLLLTGTPAGVGPVQAGDRVEVAMQGLGVLSNTFQPE